MTVWWEFADKVDLEHSIGVAAPTWYYAREFARSLLGEGCIQIATWSLGDHKTPLPKYQLKWSGNACLSSSNLRLQVRKLNKRGKYTSWRYL
jgi:hypothetical protein